MITLSLNHHGGGCCGISHISGFAHFQKKNRERFQLYIDECSLNGESDGHLIEITLTDDQISRFPILKKELKKQGFYLVSRFMNHNSVNYVNVLHCVVGESDNELEGSPYNDPFAA